MLFSFNSEIVILHLLEILYGRGLKAMLRRGIRLEFGKEGGVRWSVLQKLLRIQLKFFLYCSTLAPTHRACTVLIPAAAEWVPGFLAGGATGENCNYAARRCDVASTPLAETADTLIGTVSLKRSNTSLVVSCTRVFGLCNLRVALLAS
jgi:hypothetical protein